MCINEKEAQKASGDVINVRKVVYKNLLVVGLTQLLNSAAISPTNVLATTIAGKTLGNITFGLNHVFSCLFSFFTISMLDKETSKKMVILFGSACIVGFAACNWYVSYYTLIPGTILFGAGLSASWITSLIYTKKLSVNYTKNYNLNEQAITSFFTGIILGLSLIGYLLGNATTSGVLMLLKSDDGDNNTVSVEVLNNMTTLDNSNECQTNDDKLEFNFITVNTLRGLVIFYPLLGFIIGLLFLDNLEKKKFQINLQSTLPLNFIKDIWLNFVSLIKLLAKKEMIMSCPLFIASGANLSFAFTIYTIT